MSSPARILIVSSGNPCRNPRPVKEAAALGHAGYNVTLLTPPGDLSLAEIDRQLIGTSSFRHETLPPTSATFRRCLQWLARRAIGVGVQSIGALGSAAPLLQRTRKLHADLTVVHNEIPHWIGVQLMKENRRVAADIEDWHSEDLLPEDRRRRPLRLLRAVERGLLSRAAYTSTTSDALAEALHARYGGTRPHVVTNSFPLQPVPRRCEPNEPPTFFWFSQTVGPGRGLEQFLQIWKLTRQPSRLVLLGTPRVGYGAGLLSQLPEIFRTRVRFLPLVSPTELPTVIAAHDIGLALEQSAIVNRDLTITNKILQYLNAGLAIVATDTAGQREVLAHLPEAGLIFDRSNAAEQALRLDALLSNRAELTLRQTAARELAETKYCWEHEAPRLVGYVAQALARPIPGVSRSSP